MDQGLYTLLGAVIAGAIALIGIRVREQRLDRDRFTDRKQALYTDLWTVCDRHQRDVSAQVEWRRQLGQREDARRRFEAENPEVAAEPPTSWEDGPAIGSTEPARLALKALELLAPPEVVAAATQLYQQTADLGAQFAWDGTGVPTIPPKIAWPTAVDSWTNTADVFLDAARKDLRRTEA